MTAASRSALTSCAPTTDRAYGASMETTDDVWAVVERQIAEDRVLYEAAGITEPVECPRCHLWVATFLDAGRRLRFDRHQFRGKWCGKGGARV